MLLSLDLVATLFTSAKGILPVFARDVFVVGAGGYGLLAAAPAVGSIVGATLVVGLGFYRRKGVLVLVALVGYSLALVVFAQTTFFPLAVLALGVSGLFDAISATVRKTVVQLVTPDQLRGRAGSIQSMAARGGPSLGYAQVGALAALLGAPAALTLGAAFSLAYTLVIALRGRAVRDYQDQT
jgi:hypothetical protein